MESIVSKVCGHLFFFWASCYAETGKVQPVALHVTGRHKPVKKAAKITHGS
jgi:hypothetical protein